MKCKQLLLHKNHYCFAFISIRGQQGEGGIAKIPPPLRSKISKIPP